MVPRLLILPEARQDLEDIRDYTAQTWGEAQAVRYLSGLRGFLDHLATFPRSCPRFAPVPTFRVAVYRLHYIAYREEADGIAVARIIDQRRDHTRVIASFAGSASDLSDPKEPDPD